MGAYWRTGQLEKAAAAGREAPGASANKKRTRGNKKGGLRSSGQSAKGSQPVSTPGGLRAVPPGGASLGGLRQHQAQIAQNLVAAGGII